MWSLLFAVFICSPLTAINADSCAKAGRTTYSQISNILISLPEEDEFWSAIEMVRDDLWTMGDPEIGSIDPLYIENDRYEQDDDDMNIDMNVTAATVNGLLGFEVTDIKRSMNGKRFQVDLLFPELSSSGEYSFLSQPPMQRFQIFGSGSFASIFTNLRIQINGDVGKRSDGIRFIEKLESELSLESADFKVTGLLDNDLVSEIASWGLSQYMPESVSLLKSDVDELLQLYADEVNSVLFE